MILCYLGLNDKCVKSVHAQYKRWFRHLKNICKCDIKWSKQEATTGHVHASPHLDGFSIPFGSTGKSDGVLEVPQECGGLCTRAGGETSAHVIGVCFSTELHLSSLVSTLVFLSITKGWIFGGLWCLSGYRHLPPSQIPWVPSLKPTLWKERTNF